MTSVHINPGSGPVIQATEQNAIDNMTAFVADLKERGIEVHDWDREPAADYGNGRYAFAVLADELVEVQMPGLPLDQVRWLGPDQDIWQFPRLYVDDSSWIWYFALNTFDDDDALCRWADGTVRGGEAMQFTSTKAVASDGR